MFNIQPWQTIRMKYQTSLHTFAQVGRTLWLSREYRRTKRQAAIISALESYNNQKYSSFVLKYSASLTINKVGHRQHFYDNWAHNLLNRFCSQSETRYKYWNIVTILPCSVFLVTEPEEKTIASTNSVVGYLLNDKMAPRSMNSV